MSPIKKKAEDMCTTGVTVYMSEKEKKELMSRAYSKEMYMSTYIKLLIKKDLKKK